MSNESLSPASSSFRQDSGSGKGVSSILKSSRPTVDNTCPVCKKTFERRYNLQVHLRKHTGETPYSCPVLSCNKQFMWRSSMSHHVRTHHDVQEVPQAARSIGSKTTKVPLIPGTTNPDSKRPMIEYETSGNVSKKPKNMLNTSYSSQATCHTIDEYEFCSMEALQQNARGSNDAPSPTDIIYNSSQFSACDDNGNDQNIDDLISELLWAGCEVKQVDQIPDTSNVQVDDIISNDPVLLLDSDFGTIEDNDQPLDYFEVASPFADIDESKNFF